MLYWNSFKTNFTILCFTETHVKLTLQNSFLDIQNYSIFRTDGQSKLNVGRVGVAIHVNINLQANTIILNMHTEVTHTNAIWCKIQYSHLININMIHHKLQIVLEIK